MKVKRFLSLFLAVLLLNAFCGVTTLVATQQNSTSSIKRYIIKFNTSNVNKSQLVSKYNGKVEHQYKHFNAVTADLTAQNLTNLKKDSNIAYIQQDYAVKISSSAKPIKLIKSSKISNSSSYADDNGHGTHVAGIIDGQGLNGAVKGSAPDASIYAVKALDSQGEGYTSDIIAGIDWAIDNKMDIISMSLGSSESDPSLQDAVNTAYNDGLLVVAAAGNDGNDAGTGSNIEYPANYDSAIAVGAVDSTNTRDYFSSTGSKLEVITSTYLNEQYAQMSGTSMATPFVPPAPISTVKAGKYKAPLIVDLYDRYSKPLKIYYTLDGSIPTAQSNLYTGPISIQKSTAILAVAVDKSGNSSRIAYAVYIISPNISRYNSRR